MKGSLVVHANYANLESWQIGKLQKAYMQGRKKIKVCMPLWMRRDMWYIT